MLVFPYVPSILTHPVKARAQQCSGRLPCKITPTLPGIPFQGPILIPQKC